MAFYDTALDLATSDPTTAAIVFGAGFIVCHLIHAIRYSFFGGFSSGIFDKIKKFFKILFFVGEFSS